MYIPRFDRLATDDKDLIVVVSMQMFGRVFKENKGFTSDDWKSIYNIPVGYA